MLDISVVPQPREHNHFRVTMLEPSAAAKRTVALAQAAYLNELHERSVLTHPDVQRAFAEARPAIDAFKANLHP